MIVLRAFLFHTADALSHFLHGQIKSPPPGLRLVVACTSSVSMAKARFVVCCPGKLGTGDEVESNTRSMQGPQKEHRLICLPLHCGKLLSGKCPVLAAFPM